MLYACEIVCMFGWIDVCVCVCVCVLCVVQDLGTRDVYVIEDFQQV